MTAGDAGPESDQAAPERILTRETLAAALAVSTYTVDQWREQGMPWHHWGRRLVRFRLSEVTAWLDQQDE